MDEYFFLNNRLRSRIIFVQIKDLTENIKLNLIRVDRRSMIQTMTIFLS